MTLESRWSRWSTKPTKCILYCVRKRKENKGWKRESSSERFITSRRQRRRKRLHRISLPRPVLIREKGKPPSCFCSVFHFDSCINFIARVLHTTPCARHPDSYSSVHFSLSLSLSLSLMTCVPLFPRKIFQLKVADPILSPVIPSRHPPPIL